MKIVSKTSFASRCNSADVRLISRELGYGIGASDWRRVDDIWRNLEQKDCQPRFEKTILNVLDFSFEGDAVKIVCGLMPYRCLIARLYEDLSSIKPLALTGIAERGYANEILVGRRARDASSHGGFYETTPSGGVELEDVRADGAVDILRRLCDELFEETGIPQSNVMDWRVFGFYYDAPTATLDIIMRIFLAVDQPVFQATAEYDQLIWLTPTKILDYLGSSDVSIVDVSRWAMTEWLGIPR